jgi:outer membrane protein OmpA-like peptidoglycan-associated protein/Tol biopolymer transport system component
MMINTKSLFLFLFLLVFFESNAQTIVSIKPAQLSPKLLKIYQEGIKFSKKGKPKDAIKNYDKVLKEEPRFLEAKLKKAGLAYDINDLDLARKLIDEVIAVDPKYDAEMYYAAALCTKPKKDYEHSSKYLTQYLKYNTGISPDQSKKVKREIAENDFRINALKNPKSLTVQKVDASINSSGSEYLPFITIDNKQMIFTRQEFGKEDLYVSTKRSDGSWGKAALLNGVKSQYDEAALTMSADGNMIVYTSNDKITSFGGYDLFTSRKENGTWTKAMNLGKKINSVAKETQPCIADNGKTIYFASNRQGGLGGTDIYVVTRTADNKWSQPVNLGPTINTPGNDESPFIHADGTTLYFRSNGHIGMGSDDIYFAKLNPETKSWSEPINMGYPINTENSEGALFIDRKGEYAYFASSLETKKRGVDSLDIYYFELPLELRPEPVSYIKVNIQDATTLKNTKAKYDIIDLTTKDTISSGTATDGIVITSIKKNKNYALQIDKDKYYFHSENFNTTEIYDASKPYEIIVKLKPIETIPDAPIVLNNIFFETGSSVLLNESQIEINKLATFLKSNQNLKIKITGHTDNVGSDVDNQRLSDARAKAVLEALVQKGIEAYRLSHEGKGESIPIADNNTAEGRKANRRTEFVVLK